MLRGLHKMGQDQVRGRSQRPQRFPVTVSSAERGDMRTSKTESTMDGPPPIGFGRGLRLHTVILTLGAAAMNLSVLSYRFTEYLPFGILFSLVALLQIAFSFVALSRPD